MSIESRLAAPTEARSLRRGRRGGSVLAIGMLLALGACGTADDPVGRGAALAEEKGCHACHGAKGVSQAPAFPNLAGQWPRYLRIQLLKYRSGERENAVMNGQAANLTRREIADLAAFYADQ